MKKSALAKPFQDRTEPPGAALEKAKKEIEQLKISEKKHRRSERIFEELTSELKERVKELNCLYAISKIVEQEGLTLEEVLQKTVDTIPDAWQYPEITYSRIILGEKEFRTTGFKETEWKQSQSVMRKGSKAGSLEVFYGEERPLRDEGPFLKEERSLINVIAERIGATVERKMAQKALRESESKNRALLDAIPDLMFEINEEGVLTGFHEGQFHIPGDLSDGLIGKSISSINEINRLLPDRVLDHGLSHARAALETGRVQVFEQHIFLGGERKDVEVRMVVCTGRNVLGIVRDITRRKRLEAEILEISGREQRRIGQDLHDSLCQQLAGIGFMTKVLEKKITGRQNVNTSDVAEIITLIDEAITLTRGYARGLNPVRLESEGFMMALSELAITIERLFGISCSLEYIDEILIDDNAVATNLYRIVQEGLSNAIKHGKADKIVIGLNRDENTCVVTVKDNGCGIGNAVNHGKGIGMNIMQYRASMIGASLEIKNDDPCGTILTCSFHGRHDI